MHLQLDLGCRLSKCVFCILNFFSYLFIFVIYVLIGSFKCQLPRILRYLDIRGYFLVNDVVQLHHNSKRNTIESKAGGSLPEDFLLARCKCVGVLESLIELIIS